MNKLKGVIRPRPRASFFIGWEAKAPPVDRRALLALSGALLIGAGAGAYGLATHQESPGDGAWNQGDERVFRGVILVDPYPRLVSADIDTGAALLVCPTKCGVQRRVNGMHAEGAVVRGTVLARGPHRMIAVSDADEALRADPAAPIAAIPAVQDLGEIVLGGEILDSKCWFGAMRPGAGKAHKSCAALCLRFGVPPAFFAQDQKGRQHAFIMTDPDGGALGDRLLELVADPVVASGRLAAVGEGVRFLVDPARIVRR